jgi:hypothetical protein
LVNGCGAGCTYFDAYLIHGQLVGNTDTKLNIAAMNRIQDISKLSLKDNELKNEFLDSFILNRKIKNVLQ